MQIGIVGLGKMGLNIGTRLHQKKYQVVGYNRSEGPRKEAQELGIKAVDSLGSLVENLSEPRVLWLMVPNTVVDAVLEEVLPMLSKGDLVIDGGNSFYKNSVARGEKATSYGVKFIDVGVSGGPKGALEGACLMVGGESEDFAEVESLFKDLSVPEGYVHVGKVGAGHFVKMVHNGIEYGMMQSIAEGFEIMKKSEFDLNLKDVARVYNHGSVIQSRLTGWLEEGFEKYGEDLEEASGTVSHSGMGEWTIQAGEELGVSTPAISSAMQFRKDSENSPSFTGRVLSTLRNMFGGHDVK